MLSLGFSLGKQEWLTQKIMTHLTVSCFCFIDLEMSDLTYFTCKHSLSCSICSRNLTSGFSPLFYLIYVLKVSVEDCENDNHKIKEMPRRMQSTDIENFE